MKLQQPVVSEDYVPSVLVGASCGGSSMSAGILVKDESNKGDPAARVYIGTSAVAERGGYGYMDYEAEYEGYGGISYIKSIYMFHESQVVRSSSQGIKEYELSLRSPSTRKTLFSFKGFQ